VDNAEVVRRFWDRVEARDWERAGELLAGDFVSDWPHSAERFRGRDNYIAMNRAYPEGWRIEVGVGAPAGRIAAPVYSRGMHPNGNVYLASAAREFDVPDVVAAGKIGMAHAQLAAISETHVVPLAVTRDAKNPVAPLIRDGNHFSPACPRCVHLNDRDQGAPFHIFMHLHRRGGIRVYPQGKRFN
jgi:hypothetical protein